MQHEYNSLSDFLFTPMRQEKRQMCFFSYYVTQLS